jgi:hypothetical protein
LIRPVAFLFSLLWKEPSGPRSKWAEI